METRQAPFVTGASGPMKWVAAGCGLIVAAALLSGLAVRGGDDSTKASRKDTGSASVLIDRLLEEGWKKAGVKPAKPATDDEFLRRAYVDLLGRIPNVQEAKAFLGTRESGKRAKLVEYLLEHPDFAKNFATQWTILLIGRGNQGRMVDRGAFGLVAKAIRGRAALE